MHQALPTEPVYGPAFRRGAGIARGAARRAEDQLEWWTATLVTVLGLDS